ncbi:MAG: hypothetical protein WCT51_03095 [Candidatus Shapirobacteria bacterium]|jgi:hypothetical protein
MSEQKNNPPPQELVISEPKTIEYDLPYIHIPNGYPENDQIHTVINQKNEPIKEELKEFFTPEMVSRLIKCPKINIDETDDWGMFGYEPGYFFICGIKYKGDKTLNDMALLNGMTLKNSTTKTGYEITEISHADSFPRNKYIYQTITVEKTPKTFTFLRNLLEGVDGDDLSTYPTEDLLFNLKKIRDQREIPDVLLESAERFRSSIKESRDPDYSAQMADKYEQEAEKKKQETPINTLKSLEIINILQERKIVDSTILNIINSSYKYEEKRIKQDINQAKLNGNNQLAEEITTFFKRIEPLLENNQKQLTSN